MTTINMLQGYRTYILSTLGILTVVAYGIGLINADVAQMLLPLFGFGGLISLRASVK